MGDAALPMRELKYKERPGFDTRTMRWLYRVLYPFFHCRVNLPAELRDSEEPVVFIGNHYNVFGPVSFILSMPVVARAWINVELVQEGCSDILADAKEINARREKEAAPEIIGTEVSGQ